MATQTTIIRRNSLNTLACAASERDGRYIGAGSPNSKIFQVCGMSAIELRGLMGRFFNWRTRNEVKCAWIARDGWTYRNANRSVCGATYNSHAAIAAWE